MLLWYLSMKTTDENGSVMHSLWVKRAGVNITNYQQQKLTQLQFRLQVTCFCCMSQDLNLQRFEIPSVRQFKTINSDVFSSPWLLHLLGFDKYLTFLAYESSKQNQSAPTLLRLVVYYFQDRPRWIYSLRFAISLFLLY